MIGKKMLKAATPKIELPKWFEVRAESSDNKTKLTLLAMVDGQNHAIEREIDKDQATVMDLVELWPDVAAKIPAIAKKVLDFLPVPRKCKITGFPLPNESSPTLERARLKLEARVLTKDLEWFWDSDIDRLYVGDLIEMVDWLKAIQRQKEDLERESEARKEGAAS